MAPLGALLSYCASFFKSSDLFTCAFNSASLSQQCWVSRASLGCVVSMTLTAWVSYSVCCFIWLCLAGSRSAPCHRLRHPTVVSVFWHLIQFHSVLLTLFLFGRWYSWSVGQQSFDDFPPRCFQACATELLCFAFLVLATLTRVNSCMPVVYWIFIWGNRRGFPPLKLPSLTLIWITLFVQLHVAYWIPHWGTRCGRWTVHYCVPQFVHSLCYGPCQFLLTGVIYKTQTQTTSETWKSKTTASLRKIYQHSPHHLCLGFHKTIWLLNQSFFRSTRHRISVEVSEVGAYQYVHTISWEVMFPMAPMSLQYFNVLFPQFHSLSLQRKKFDSPPTLRCWPCFLPANCEVLCWTPIYCWIVGTHYVKVGGSSLLSSSFGIWFLSMSGTDKGDSLTRIGVVCITCRSNLAGLR